MEEVLPGVFQWSAVHPKLAIEVGCHFDARSQTAIDPLLPPGGLEWFESHRPKQVVLSNRHHLRHAEQIAARFGCPILCHEAGLHEFERGPEVQGFQFGEELGPGLVACNMSAICPDDTALHLEAGGGALLFADSVIHYGELGFVPNGLIGEEPEAVKRQARRLASGLLDLRFDSLLFAHGAPLIGGGKDALRSFCEAA